MFCGALAKELKGSRHKITDWMVQNRYVREFHVKVFACLILREFVVNLLFSYLQGLRMDAGIRRRPCFG